MESAWRRPNGGGWPEWIEPWMQPFASTIDAASKFVVSTTLSEVNWNSELVDTADLGASVQALKKQSGSGLAVGGVALPATLAELGLIDEYELIVHPHVATRGRRLLEGMTRPLDLALVDRTVFDSGAVALVYEQSRTAG